MPRQAMHVAGRLGPMIAERGAAVFGAHQPAQLDADQHHLGIVRARCDPAHVRGPGPGRKAPVRPRRDLLERRQLLPALAAVAAAEQPAGLRSDVHGAVRRTHRHAEDVELWQRHVVEGVAAVSAALQAASPTADVHRVTVECQALRSRILQARVGTDPHERVPRRRKQLHRHRIARHRRACAPRSCRPVVRDKGQPVADGEPCPAGSMPSGGASDAPVGADERRRPLAAAGTGWETGFDPPLGAFRCIGPRLSAPRSSRSWPSCWEPVARPPRPIMW